ncbi:hypothetical protein HB662_01455 [Roseomonas frigidaquae]|uniref:Uncharacterized protein n=1 Tax=Falsiroseomonas frigidaquae TaxID=487318 RepID=A0ABX1ESC9_9PROT|nr:hypothetical protein [Falsiroseomonas frigidaquae]NKE43425.1 hypothetical protein [Falsiroseomonas frigidaquae]
MSDLDLVMQIAGRLHAAAQTAISRAEVLRVAAKEYDAALQDVALARQAFVECTRANPEARAAWDRARAGLGLQPADPPAIPPPSDHKGLTLVQGGKD